MSEVKYPNGYCTQCLERIYKCECLEKELEEALKLVKIINPKDKENE